jgi:hypothetical protein
MGSLCIIARTCEEHWKQLVGKGFHEFRPQVDLRKRDKVASIYSSRISLKMNDCFWKHWQLPLLAGCCQSTVGGT